MSHQVNEIVRNTGSFRVDSGRLLLFRVGPANGRVQTHNACARDMRTGERREWDPAGGDYADYSRRTPERRGFWAFPYPFHDAFFYWHVWERHLPKRFAGGAFDYDLATEVETDAYNAERAVAFREVRRRIKPKLIWHDGPFWSHVRPRGSVGERNWWRYENAREWIDSARGDLWCYNRYGDEPVWKSRYSKDHLELFIPG